MSIDVPLPYNPTEGNTFRNARAADFLLLLPATILVERSRHYEYQDRLRGEDGHVASATCNVESIVLAPFFLSLWVLFCFLGVVLFPKIILFVDRFVMEANLWFFTSQLIILLVTSLIAVSVSLQVNSAD